MPRRCLPIASIAAYALLALSMTGAPARSEGVFSRDCYGNYPVRSCVEIYRSGRVSPNVIAAPQSAEDRAAAEARDKRWLARCQPTIRSDLYGMPRYSFAAAGCEFGRFD